MPHSKLTKEEIIDEIEKYGCKKMTNLPLDRMTRADIILHLEECKCPKLKRLKEELKI
jgi:hypothetical protein